MKASIFPRHTSTIFCIRHHLHMYYFYCESNKETFAHTVPGFFASGGQGDSFRENMKHVPLDP